MAKNNKKHYLDRFDDYHLKKMSIPEIIQFEEDLKNDPEMRKNFEVYKLAVIGIQADNLKDKIQEIYKKKHSNGTKH